MVIVLGAGKAPQRLQQWQNPGQGLGLVRGLRLLLEIVPVPRLVQKEVMGYRLLCELGMVMGMEIGMEMEMEMRLVFQLFLRTMGIELELILGH